MCEIVVIKNVGCLCKLYEKSPEDWLKTLDKFLYHKSEEIIKMILQHVTS